MEYINNLPLLTSYNITKNKKKKVHNWTKQHLTQIKPKKILRPLPKFFP